MTMTKASLMITAAAGFVGVLYFWERGHSEMIERQVAEARLRLLQAQIEPHFLFNTLANLQALIAAESLGSVETALDVSVAYAKERGAQLKLPLNQPRDEDEKLAPSHLPVPAFPEAAMMMTFVNMEAPGITILPTHRVLHGLENFNVVDFTKRASEFFDIRELHTPDPAVLANTKGTAIIVATRDGNFLFTAKPDAVAKALADLHIPAHQAQLDVVQLHSLILDRILGLTQETITKLGNVRYLREVSEALGEVTSGQADVAFLIKPITLDQLRDVSLSGDVMPQKSTDFYPKLLSGLAIYALD